VILLISVSWIARIIGVSHRGLAVFVRLRQGVAMQPGLSLNFFLPHPPECWDYMYMPPAQPHVVLTDW
jgi:hypothetical protein